MSDCSALYAPDADIAGQATFIAFLSHTCIFAFLDLILVPIIRLYIPVRPFFAGEDDEDDEHPLRSSERTSESDSPHGIRAKWPCQAAEALQNTYTSQYITGIAFVVATFAKWNSTSQYHRNVVFCLVAMNSMVGAIVNFDRPFILGYRVQASVDGKRGFNSKTLRMVDFALLFTLLVFVGFGFSTLVALDDQFERCFKHWTELLIASMACFGVLGAIVVKPTRGPRSSIAWLVFIIATALFISFQSVLFRRMTRVFRPREFNTNSETVFSFGQILVLFMIFPLIADFTAGMIVDLRKIYEANNNSVPFVQNSLTNVVRVLLPYFIGRVWHDLTGYADRLLIHTAAWLTKPWSWTQRH